jgi:hypothetical protein
MRAKGARDSIDVACPRCGARLAMRITRLNETRKCQGCGTSFSINDRGRYVLEEFSAAVWLASLARQLGLKRVWKSCWERAGNARARWLRVPTKWRVATCVVCGVCLPMLVASWAYTTWTLIDDNPQEHAESLHMRAGIACQALLAGDDGLLAGLATRESQDEMRHWFQRVRPAHWPSSQDLAKTADVELRTLFKSLKTQRAAVYFTIRRRDKRPARDAPDATGTLCWTLGHDGRWQLDGRRTLEELSVYRGTD